MCILSRRAPPRVATCSLFRRCASQGPCRACAHLKAAHVARVEAGVLGDDDAAGDRARQLAGGVGVDRQVDLAVLEHAKLVHDAHQQRAVRHVDARLRAQVLRGRAQP